MLAKNLERREYTIELKSFTSILKLLGVLCVKWRLPHSRVFHATCQNIQIFMSVKVVNMYKLMRLLECTENFQNQDKLTHLAWIWSFGLENLAACYLVHLGSSRSTPLINLSSFLRKSSFTRKIKRPTQLKSLLQKYIQIYVEPEFHFLHSYKIIRFFA